MKTPKNEYEMIKENWHENISVIKNKKTNDFCICKKIFMKTEKEIMNAENEAKILEKLDHKNIVSIMNHLKKIIICLSLWNFVAKI